MKLTKKQMLIWKAPATVLNQTSATDEGIRVAKRRPNRSSLEGGDELSPQAESHVAA